MTRDEFIAMVRVRSPERIVYQFLEAETITACNTQEDYERFRRLVQEEYPNASEVHIVGSGNWGYSLNPRKNFAPFNTRSDVDVAVVSVDDFTATWDELRGYERRLWYTKSGRERNELREHMHDVYCGFISPEWITEKGNRLRFRFLANLQRFSCDLVGYKPVRMRLFRNRLELVDYYKRGIMIARGGR